MTSKSQHKRLYKRLCIQKDCPYRGELGQQLANSKLEVTRLLEGIDDLRQQLSQVTKERDEAIEVLKPFSHPDLCKATSSTIQGDNSPLWGRDRALLKLGDFRKAKNIVESNNPSKE